MNRTYESKEYESNCSFVNLNGDSHSSTALDALGKLIVGLTSAKALGILRVVLSLVCFIGFLGTIGGVESGSLSLGTGIIISIFMVFIEILCFLPKKRN